MFDLHFGHNLVLEYVNYHGRACLCTVVEVFWTIIVIVRTIMSCTVVEFLE